MLRKIGRLAERGIAWLWRKMSWKQRLIAVSVITMALLGLGTWGYFHFRPAPRPPKESNLSLGQIERLCFELVNRERQAHGLQPLQWNDELAAVARSHSRDLAREGAPLTQIGWSVNLPLIHHEGFDYPYHSDRLARAGVHYFSASAENIALAPAHQGNWQPFAGDPRIATADEQQATCKKITAELKAAEHDKSLAYADKLAFIRQKIRAGKKLFAQGFELPGYRLTWNEQGDICNGIVQGWMNSPGHRKNILMGEFDEAGMGSAYVNGYLILTQVFITRATCGYEGGPCCEEAGYYPYCFKGLECNDGICRKAK